MGVGGRRWKVDWQHTCIVIAFEVSQLWMLGLRFAHIIPPPPGVLTRLKRYEKSAMAETSHVLIAPYVASAEDGLVHHASRAVFSAALVAKHGNIHDACPTSQ